MVNIIQVGLGPLGQKAVRYALERGTITINAMRSIVKAAPGLRTMIDLPPVGFTAAF